ncbi:MAG: YlxR family protein [Firmicutes bacterium]|nr:YlxR family protein [Bacillota bacterium]
MPPKPGSAKPKSPPMRMCLACRQMKDKRTLIRIVKSPEGEISLDFTGKKNGRGAYICNDAACIQKCCKSRLIHKAFSMDVGREVYDRILEELGAR